MAKAFVTAMIGLMVLSASANAGEHRTGHYGSHPGGGVTVGPSGGGRGGRTVQQPVKVMPAPNVPHEKNFGIYANTRNVRDHRGCLGPGAGPCAGAAPR
jgi:hypothetical protein